MVTEEDAGSMHDIRELPDDLVTQRPGWLPDFKRPPVNEVSLGVDIQRLTKMRNVHLGVLYDRWHDRFPVVEEALPSERAVESFDSPPEAPLFKLVQIERPPIPQIWFVNDADDLAVKVQADAFAMTWRRRSDDYPHYEQLKAAFYSEYLGLGEAAAEAGLGDLVIEQAEVRYVNHIPLDDLDHSAHLDRVLKRWSADVDVPSSHSSGDLPLVSEEAIALRRSFLITPDPLSPPAARLHVTVGQDPAADGALRLELAVRGFPGDTSVEATLAFFDMGRALIVQTFTDLTTDEMHTRWERIR